MTKIIDARKLTCPQPVVLTKKALKTNDEVTTIVDNETARENVTRLGKNEGCEVKIKSKKDGIYLTLKKATTQACAIASTPPLAAGTVLFLGSDIIGRGENIALGNLLMQSFLHTIGGLEDRPDTILLMNNGAKLVTQESPVLGELKQLESQGMEILACGTCLARLGLTDKIAVGKVSNMYEITGKMLKADRVISL